MKIDDEIRLKIMDAMMDDEAAKPNIEYLVKKTGMSRRTIYNSIDFLKKEKVFSGFAPIIDRARLGFNITKACLIGVDSDKPEDIQAMTTYLINHPRIYWFSDIIGSDTYHFVSMQVYRSIDECHHLSRECCKHADLVKNRQSFFIDTEQEHLHKNICPAKCAVKMLIEENKSKNKTNDK